MLRRIWDFQEQQPTEARQGHGAGQAINPFLLMVFFEDYCKHKGKCSSLSSLSRSPEGFDGQKCGPSQALNLALQIDSGTAEV